MRHDLYPGRDRLGRTRSEIAGIAERVEPEPGHACVACVIPAARDD